ncbi:PLC-like phosphodiesterase [Hypoxylon crocopeplum]|nr:PLC-like phosphodiesterase [Hypoxylon crocopeplum]
MPPPRGASNPLEGPGDYDTTSIVHNDTYPAIDSSKADFSGKVVFISGASRGLGKAMCISFAKAGASMIAIGARSDLSATVKEMKTAATSVGKPEPTVLPLVFDVTDHKSVDGAAAQVKKNFGHVDIVINNAGKLGTSLIVDSNPDEWWKIWQVNLVGPYLVSRAFIPLLLEGTDKTIITVSSVGAHVISPSLSAYQTSKLAVLRLSEFIVAEYGDKGILSYCIHPGNIPTDMVSEIGGIDNLTPELRAVFVETPELSADSLVYLTSQKRDWLGGRYINVTWDLPELMEKEDEIVKGDKLKVRLRCVFRIVSSIDMATTDDHSSAPPINHFGKNGTRRAPMSAKPYRSFGLFEPINLPPFIGLRQELFMITSDNPLNPLSKLSDGEYDEDVGEEVDEFTIAGGGHSARQTNITKNQLRVSHALKSFLIRENVLSEREVDFESENPSDALQALLDKSHIEVPFEVTDRSYPLPEYFISSSHNTYLLGHQLVGKSSATAYETALNAGSRCVEIDAWDNEDNKEEPKVTHGYTLVSHIPFRTVCETIRDVMDREAVQSQNAQGYRAAPIMLSLENHCEAYGQQRLVDIMKEVFGDRLLSKAIREKGHREQQGDSEPVTLAELGSKIVVIVEYHLPEEADTSDDSNSSSEDEEERQVRAAYRAKKAAASSPIVPKLAELGVYAQSVKPRDNSWFESVLKDGPHNHLINVSETGLASYMPAASAKIAHHNSRHLMRVFPKGTRISSKNLKQVPFWGIGAQICAMNWQTFNASMQINEALFSGTEGYVLKPAALRAGGSMTLNKGRRKRLVLHVAGATDLPVPEGQEEEDVKPYVTCTLVHPDELGGEHPKRKTGPYKHHKLGFLHRGENPPPTDPLWDEALEWEFEDSELVFVRILIKNDVSFAENPVFAVAAVRLMYVVPGWSFIRMLDLKGRETKCSLLVKFHVHDV